ncbi:MAG: UPF0758 domain-containing protein, partial [Bacteroidota bacterium]
MHQLFDRPRERLLRNGIAALSNTDLVAILLGSGSLAVPLMSICEALIAMVDNDPGKLSDLSLDQLQQIKGIGKFKGMTLLAAFELGRRSMKPGAPLSLKDDEAVKKYGGRAFVSVNKALVTQSSSAIPFIPLYFVILMKIMKHKGIHED